MLPIVLTGGPGSGKTTLINALQAKGIAVMPEVSREILATEKENNGDGLPWINPDKFHLMVLEGRMQQYKDACSMPKPIFLDRGIPDSFAYLVADGQSIPPEDWEKMAAFPYHNTVLITPPWKEIYANDEQRWEDFEHATRIFNALSSVYRTLGYTVVEVPKSPINERVSFIMDVFQ